MLSLSGPLFSENEPDWRPKPGLKEEFGISARNSGPHLGTGETEKKIQDSEKSGISRINPGIWPVDSEESASVEAEQRKNPSREYAWTGLPYWDPGQGSGFQPLYSFQALGASDAGGTEKPFHRASGSRGELILGGDYASREFGVLILGAALGQDSLVSRQSQGGLYTGMFWMGSPSISLASAW